MITIAYVNFWTDQINKNDDYFTRFISSNIGPVSVVSFDQNPNLLIASCFGDINRVINIRAKKKMFYYGENLSRYPPYNDDALLNQVFDLVVGFCHVRFPLWLLYYPFYRDGNDIIHYIQTQYDNNSQSEKTFFATQISRHDRGGQRGLISDIFEKIGRVVYAGVFRNNHPSIGPSAQDKIRFISKSVFNICPENSASPGYCTEKIFQALEGGTIPVYWGHDRPELGVINPNKYIFIEKNVNIDRIIPLDYLGEPVFVDGASDVISEFYANLNTRITHLINK